MTKKEAYEQARKDWESEDDYFEQNGAYMNKTPTQCWLAMLEEIDELALIVSQKCARLAEGTASDKEILRHYQPNRAYLDHWQMRTVDKKGAERLVWILRRALNSLTKFEDDRSNLE